MNIVYIFGVVNLSKLFSNIVYIFGVTNFIDVDDYLLYVKHFH